MTADDPGLPNPEADGSDERAILVGWLRFHRSGLARKCAGLSAEQLVSMAAPPSNLSLIGLVRHLTEMENVYFRCGLTGDALQLIYASDDDPDADFERVEPATAQADLARWRSECAHSDLLIAQAESMDAPGPDGNPALLRRRIVKVLQEYARHNGHADLIRQRIDGAVGE